MVCEYAVSVNVGDGPALHLESVFSISRTASVLVVNRRRGDT